LKGLGRRRRTLVLDNLRNRRRYWLQKEETEDKQRWKRKFITSTEGIKTIYLPQINALAKKQHAE
jgi:hypothetical protein